jgi:CrcB protein
MEKMMVRFLLVCAGGAIGTGCRYLIALWAPVAFGTAFPAGTLIVNLAGSFLMGFVMQVGSTTGVLSINARLALTTGVLGGFTTYSAFNYQTTEYVRAGAWHYAALYLVATLLGCFAAGFAGLALARLIAGR